MGIKGHRNGTKLKRARKLRARNREFTVVEEIEKDFRAALAALKANGDEPTIPWEDVKKSLGLEDDRL